MVGEIVRSIDVRNLPGEAISAIIDRMMDGERRSTNSFQAFGEVNVGDIKDLFEKICQEFGKLTVINTQCKVRINLDGGKTFNLPSWDDFNEFDTTHLEAVNQIAIEVTHFLKMDEPETGKEIIERYVSKINISSTGSQHIELGSSPIRLLPTPTKCGMHPFPGVQPVKGRRGCAARNSE